MPGHATIVSTFDKDFAVIQDKITEMGDHTSHISEMIYYVVNGQPLGDDRPKGEPLAFSED